MDSAAIEQTFSVPFRHLWSTDFSGEQSASEVRALGLARFVGDAPNELLRYLISEKFGVARDTCAQWPIVLFGPSGTGKTSLAMTIISELAERASDELSMAPTCRNGNSSVKPIFMTGLDFDRRFRSALETDSVGDFRQRLIDSAGLVIDDLHRIGEKSATQAEFILVLDEMCRKNRPFVVTMDSSPQLCKQLSSQLVSRLMGGLSLPVNPPGPSARMEIIRDLAEINQLHLTEDAAKLLVERLNVTVPKLDHVFAQIKTAIRSAKQDPLDPIDAAKLTQIFKKSDQDLEQLSKLIIKQVAAEFNLKISEIKSNSRKQSIVMARGVAIYLNRKLLGTSFLKIGSYFSNRDHSTVMHANSKIEKLLARPDDNIDAATVKTVIAKLQQQLTEQFASQINFI